MSFIGSLFSNDNGAGFKAQGAQINNPVNQGQIDHATAAAQTGVQNQQDFVNALNSQNGLGNQTAALGAQQGLANQLGANNGAGNFGNAYNQQANFVNALQGQGGIANQSNVFNQQQALANQYQNVANGTGPNPAQAALNQSTGQNVANQAALMASQRGAGSNVGLIGRQAAQQGANIQQQAVGQAATLQAQQQLAGMQGLAQQQQALGQTAAGQVGTLNAAQQQQAAIAAQQVAQQQAQQQAVAGLATQQVGQQQAGIGALNNAAQGQQQNLLNAQSNYNNAQVTNQGNVNTANAGIAKGNQSFQSGALSGIAGAAGAGLGLAKGGMVPKMADGGPVLGTATTFAPAPSLSEWFTAPLAPGMSSNQDANRAAPQAAAPVTGDEAIAQNGAKLGQAIGGAGASLALQSGGKVPGQAKVKGDSYANDTVDAKLSPGEVVIPRSIMTSANPAAHAAAFVQAIMAKQGMRKAS